MTLSHCCATGSCRSLPAETVERLAAGGKLIDVLTGATVYTEADVERFGVIIRGLLRVYMHTSDGRQVTVAAAVRAATSRMDAGLVVNVQPLSDNLAMLQTLSQITASVAVLLSGLALGLAAIGVYGVVAYVVGRRRHEVGVRIALGAGAGDVQRLMLVQTLRPVAVGMSIGVFVAAMTARLLQSVLFGVSPYDPVVFAGAPVLMFAIAGAAAFVPTRRAVRISPMSVLRAE